MKTQTTHYRLPLFKGMLFGFFIAVSASLSAQTEETEVEIIQEAFGLEKKVAIADFMQLGEEAERFWALYDEYEAERKKLGMERIKVIQEYAENYANITDEKILELFKRTSEVKKAFDKLQQTYFSKMKKEVGVSKAAQFWQIESYFNSMIQAEIYAQIPFIGESLKDN